MKFCKTCKTLKTVFFNSASQIVKVRLNLKLFRICFSLQTFERFCNNLLCRRKIQYLWKIGYSYFSIIEKYSILEALAHIALKIQRLCLFEIHCHLIGMKIVNKALSFLTPRDTKILVSLFYSYKVTLYKRVISLFSNII